MFTEDMAATTTYTIEKAYSEAGPDGWDLFENGEWANRYPLKRQAVDAVARLRSQDAQAMEGQR